MHVLLEIVVIAFAVIAGILITRARFGARLRRRDDDRGDLAGVGATLPRGPKPRNDNAKVAEP
jgi:hypothetical protein